MSDFRISSRARWNVRPTAEKWAPGARLRPTSMDERGNVMSLCTLRCRPRLPLRATNPTNRRNPILGSTSELPSPIMRHQRVLRDHSGIASTSLSAAFRRFLSVLVALFPLPKRKNTGRNLRYAFLPLRLASPPFRRRSSPSCEALLPPIPPSQPLPPIPAVAIGWTGAEEDRRQITRRNLPGLPGYPMLTDGEATRVRPRTIGNGVGT